MPRIGREVGGKEEIPLLVEGLIDWLYEETAKSGEFAATRAQLYGYFQEVTHDPKVREIMHLFFGPMMLAVIRRLWEESDRDVKEFVERGRRNR